MGGVGKLPVATQVQAAYEAFKTHAVILPDLDLSLIELTGEDRVEWLQGQATNDLRGLKPGDRKSFCLCEATGQILAVCDLWVQEDRLLLTTDRATAPHILKRAEDMVILEDVQARDLSDDYELISVQGPNAVALIPPTLPSGAIVVLSSRLGTPGWDLWRPKGVHSPGLDIPTLDPDSYEIARTEAGIPKFGVDYNARTLPPELGPAFEASHVSYNKGCYMGQEVLMRIHSRGHTNKTMMGLVLEGPVQPGTVLIHAGRSEAGVVTSVMTSPRFGPIALAMVRNEAAADGERISVGAVSGVVKTLPF